MLGNGVQGVEPMHNPSVNHLQEHDPSLSATVLRMKHNPGLSLNWTPEEQAILDEGLVKYASEECNLTRYAKIALGLKNKTVRDVALRIRWMMIVSQKKEISKRRKEGHNLTRKIKDKKEKDSDPAVWLSKLAARPPNVSSPSADSAPPIIMMDSDGGINYQDELLEQNAQALKQISRNLSAFRIQENIPLFSLVRQNINALLNEVKNVPDIMKGMPPLHFNINETTANSILSQQHSGSQYNNDVADSSEYISASSVGDATFRLE